MKWINVKDELPKVDEVLLCVEFLQTGFKEVIMGHLSEYSPKSMFEGYEPLGDKRGFRKVTHWMHLPETPES